MNGRIHGTIYLQGYMHDGRLPNTDNRVCTAAYDSSDVHADHTAMSAAWQLRNPDPKVAARKVFGIILVPKWKAWVIQRVLGVRLHAEKRP